MAADLGCSMETVMAHYMSNHVAVAYGDIFDELAALSQALGFRVRVVSRNQFEGAPVGDRPSGVR